MKTLFPTPYLRLASRYIEIPQLVGSVIAPAAKQVRVLQQLWAPAGWQGQEPEGDESWRPEGEWRDVPVE